MKIFLFAFLFILVGCGEHGTESQKSTVVSETPANPNDPRKESHQIPEDAIDLDQGRYIKLIEKEGIIYAGVVIPEGVSPSEKSERLKPGNRRFWAKAHLMKHFPGKWIDEKTEHKDGYTVVMFREANPEEIKKAQEFFEDMEKSTILQ
ncbi:MAG: hypothetical protein RJA61_704 [Candidatus Parcubacteria bacterium]|jgi:hypothetical protein